MTDVSSIFHIHFRGAGSLLLHRVWPPLSSPSVLCLLHRWLAREPLQNLHVSTMSRGSQPWVNGILMGVDKRQCLSTGCLSWVSWRDNKDGDVMTLMKSLSLSVPTAIRIHYRLDNWVSESHLAQLWQLEGKAGFGKDPVMGCGTSTSCYSFCW